MMAGAIKTRYVSFYSYKGGAGRTLALANCARALAQLGKTVAIVDLDIEAPGLAHFPAFRPQGEKAPAKDRPLPELAGFAEYLEHCRRDGPPERLAGYFHRCKGATGDRGRVYLMPAGRRDGPAYRDLLSFDWDRFYREEDGYRIMENLRGHIAHDLAGDAQAPIRPDYVLIDARTGLSETGGIATHQLADLVVLLFGLNQQNLQGTVWVHDSLAALPDPPRMLLVMSPLPEIMETGKGTLFAERLGFIRKRLGKATNHQRPAILPYRPVLSWEERILVDSDEAEYLGYDQPYRDLLGLILETLQDREHYLDRAMEALRANDQDTARQALDNGLLANPDDPELLAARARLFGSSRTHGKRPAGPDASHLRLVDLAQLPAGAEHFLGRKTEFKSLDAAWTPGSGIAIVEIVAPGGTGKTALVKRWLDVQHPVGSQPGWGGATRVFGWSFYNQGSGDDRRASEDHFLAVAIDRFQVPIAQSANPTDKGQALADVICSQRTLLILDGLEPLQHPHGPLAGELRAPGLKSLLTQLATAGHPGLCILTSRERVQDLTGWVRTDLSRQGPVLCLDLANLSDADGAALLHARGATRAGEKDISPTDSKLRAASREVQGHALTLALLGRYLAYAKGGDIRQRDAIPPARSDRDGCGHAARVVAAFETWFARDGEARSRELAALRLLGFFDRPAAPDLLDTLRAAPPISGLTEPLQGLSGDGWTLAIDTLADSGLVHCDRHTGTLDAHPLVREHLSAVLSMRLPNAWREGHRRLYQRLKTATPERPDGLDGLLPLYQAVAHGCRAGLYEETRAEVYRDRILRGTGRDGFYSLKTLGAFGADLDAIACFFAEPWSRPVPTLQEADRVWLLNQAASCLRALGRLPEALQPMRVGAEMLTKRENWKNAASSYGNLSELQLTLGRVADAVADSERSVEHADRSGDALWRQSQRVTLADALHQRGENAEAHMRFAEAETLQAQRQPEFPLLNSVQGFRYCELLLADTERAAWEANGGAGPAWPTDACEAVAQRARQLLEWAEANYIDVIGVALASLMLARCAFYADRLADRPPGTESEVQTQRALDGLRAAGGQEFIVRGLLTRAWLRAAQGDGAGAEADLAEAERIATRGAMQLHLADCALYRARLFSDRAALAQARRLIETCGYGRRLPELEDAERAAADWPA